MVVDVADRIAANSVNPPAGATADSILLTPVGRLDAVATRRLRVSLAAALSSRVPRIVIDLADVPEVELPALVCLIHAQREIRARGGAIRLTNVSRAVQITLRVNGLHKVLPYDAAE